MSGPHTAFLRLTCGTERQESEITAPTVTEREDIHTKKKKNLSHTHTSVSVCTEKRNVFFFFPKKRRNPSLYKLIVVVKAYNYKCKNLFRYIIFCEVPEHESKPLGLASRDVNAPPASLARSMPLMPAHACSLVWRGT